MKVNRTFLYLSGLLMLGIIVIAAGAFFHIEQDSADMKVRIREELTTITRLKTRQIGIWRAERLGSAETVFNNPIWIDTIKAVIDDPGKDPEKKNGIIRWMKAEREASGYRNVLLVRPDGTVAITLNTEDASIGHVMTGDIEESIAKKKIIMNDLHFGSKNFIHMDILVPIVDTKDPGQKVVALFWFRIDPNTSLYPILSAWPSPTRTAETLLVRRDGDDITFLNELRFKKDAALLFKAPVKSRDLPAAMAAEGKEGIVEGTDYRGARVLACIDKIPGTPWFVVSKEDISEIYEPVRKASLQIVLVSGLILGFFISLMGILLSIESSRFTKMQYHAKVAVENIAKDWIVTFDSMIEGVSIHSPSYEILNVNSALCKLLGKTRDEIIGKKCYEIFHNKDNPLAGCPFELARDTGKKEQSELFEPFLGKWLSVSAAPVLDDKGALLKIVHVVNDITARKKSENELKLAYTGLKEAQRELVQAEKLASLGRFATGIAHEVKNPMGIILGGAEFLDEKLAQADSDTRTAISKIKEAVIRGNNILQALLKYAQPSALVFEKIDPTALIDGIIPLAENNDMFNNIKVVTDICKEKMTINADKDQMHQVLFNIIKNAGEAMPKGGIVTIRTFKKIDDNLFSGKPACVIEVVDTGVGIPDNIFSKIAEPFFTTKERKIGTGLGLFMTKNIVESHKGKLIIESKLGAGTTVKIALPCLQ